MSLEFSRVTRAWERVRSEPKLGRNVSILAVLVVLGAVSGGTILSHQRFDWPWVDRFTFYASFDNAPAVSPGHGQEVRIAGVSVGEIKAASVSDDGKAKLELAIDPQYHVYDNARVVLRPKSPLNEMYVEVNPGGPPGKQLAGGDALPVRNSERPVQVDEVLAHLDDNTRAALTSLLDESDTALAHAPQNLADGVSGTAQVARDLQPVVTALRTRKETLAKLVTALSQVSSTVGGDQARLTELAADLQKTLNAVGSHSDSVNAALGQLPDLTTQLKRATDSVQGLSDQLDPTLDNLQKATGTLPGSLEKLTSTVDQVGKTVDVANPVVTKAGPVVQDLRPFVTDLNASLPALAQVSSRLDPITSGVLPYLGDLGAFVTQTSSATSLRDGSGGILRGLLQFGPSSLPIPLLQSLSTPPQR
jgi:phospholipid/cholesterol/gamma-HCH transport system substrate-binding protein